MANKIKIKRGTRASLPTLDIGELGLATDTYEVFVGTSDGNKPVSGFLADAAYLVVSLDGKLINERQLAVGESLVVTDGGPNGAYTLNTVQDIRQTAIPRFAGFEVYSEAFAYTTVRAAGDWAECGYTLQRARGTLESPQAVSSGDTLGYMQWMGYTGSSYKASIWLIASATQNWAPNACGSRLRVYTTPNNSSTEAERLRIDHDGVVYIYSTANPCLDLAGGLKIGSLTGVLFASSGTVSALAATAGSQYLRRNAGNTAYEWAALTASDLPTHATRHETGGADAITGNLDANARVGVRVNSGANTYKRRRINFIAGAGISFSVADDSANEEVDLTVSAPGGGGGAPLDAAYLTWDTPPSELTAARLFVPGGTLLYNTDTSSQYKTSALVPIGSETAAYTLETVTQLFSSLVANVTSLSLGKKSHVAWALLKNPGDFKVFIGAGQVTGTLSYVGMDSTTTPDNIITWDAAASRFRTTATSDGQAYVQVDLGGVYSGFLFIKYRFGVYSSGTAYTRIYTSADGSSWDYLREEQHSSSTGAYMLISYSVNNVRYIRITLWKTTGTYAFIGASYTSTSINKIFFFKQGAIQMLSDYRAYGIPLEVDGSVASSSPARRALLSMAEWGPTTTAPSFPSGVTLGLSACVH